MPITEEQRQRRRKGIGSSDVPAILGLDTYRSASQVWAEKVHDLQPDETCEAAELGNMFEPALVQWAASELGFPFAEPAEIEHRDGIHRANLDGYSPQRRLGIEAKTVGLVGPGDDIDQWDTHNLIPSARCIVQCQAQCYVAGLDVVYVPVLLGRGVGRFLMKVERDDDFIAAMVIRTTRFWQHVEDRKQVSDAPLPLETLKRMKREHKTVEIEDRVYHNYVRARDDYKQAEAIYKEAQSDLIASMGDADHATCSLGEFFYDLRSRQSVDTKALKMDHPDVYAKVRRETTYRFPRIKLAKG